MERQADIEQRLAERHLQEHTLVLYDLPSSYVEGTRCPLVRREHSRDGKKCTLQIVFGLLCMAEGCLVAVEVFEGSTADPMTVVSQCRRSGNGSVCNRACWWSTAGMLTAVRIRADLPGVDGLRWVSTLCAPTIRKFVQTDAMPASLFDERGLAEIAKRNGRRPHEAVKYL